MEASVSAGMMFQRVPSQCSISAWYPCSVGTLLPTDQTSVAEIAATAVSALSAVPVLGLGITWPGQSAEASWGCWIIATKIQNQQRSMRYVFALVIPRPLMEVRFSPSPKYSLQAVGLYRDKNTCATRGRLHSMRHGAASFLLADGISPAVVRRQLRHSDARITLRSTDVVGDERRRIVQNRSTTLLNYGPIRKLGFVRTCSCKLRKTNWFGSGAEDRTEHPLNSWRNLVTTIWDLARALPNPIDSFGFPFDLKAPFSNELRFYLS